MSLRFLLRANKSNPGGDNYRLKRLNPAEYRFRRPIIGERPSLGDDEEGEREKERDGPRAELAFVSDLRGHPYERVSRTSDHRR